MLAGSLGNQKTSCILLESSAARGRKMCPTSVNINSMGTGHLWASVKVRAEISKVLQSLASGGKKQNNQTHRVEVCICVFWGPVLEGGGEESSHNLREIF